MRIRTALHILAIAAAVAIGYVEGRIYGTESALRNALSGRIGKSMWIQAQPRLNQPRRVRVRVDGEWGYAWMLPREDGLRSATVVWRHLR